MSNKENFNLKMNKDDFLALIFKLAPSYIDLPLEQAPFCTLTEVCAKKPPSLQTFFFSCEILSGTTTQTYLDLVEYETLK